MRKSWSLISSTHTWSFHCTILVCVEKALDARCPGSPKAISVLEPFRAGRPQGFTTSDNWNDSESASRLITVQERTAARLLRIVEIDGHSTTEQLVVPQVRLGQQSRAAIECRTSGCAPLPTLESIWVERAAKPTSRPRRCEPAGRRREESKTLRLATPSLGFPAKMNRKHAATVGPATKGFLVPGISTSIVSTLITDKGLSELRTRFVGRAVRRTPFGSSLDPIRRWSAAIVRAILSRCRIQMLPWIIRGLLNCDSITRYR